MRGKEIALLALALAVLAGGCGTSETKRAVVPRTEVLRFFDRETEIVGLLRTDRLAQLPAIEAAVSDLPGPEAIGARLREAGLTANEARLARSFRRSASDGPLVAAGELHEADLYFGRGGAFAVRDGVLLAGTNLREVRAALETRDGDRDEQLDDGEVDGLFDELPEGAPIHIYADFGGLIGPDRAVSGLAQDTPWLDALGKGALSVGAVGDTVELDAFARLDQESLNEQELPAGEEFASFSLSSETLGLLMPSDGAAPMRGLLLAMAPIDGEASASTDELRIRVELGP
jgi:hypothetical protein